MNAPIYLDGLSTTSLAPEARDAMLEAWSQPGNPGSPHVAGERAAALLEKARTQVAALIGAAPSELVFTSGATEANNLAIGGVARAALAGLSERRHIVISAIEHKAVTAPAMHLRGTGFTVDVAPVTRTGALDLAALAGIIRDDTLIVAVMAANNETGVVQPVAAAAELAHQRGALIHCDAAQAVGKIPIDVIELDVDYLSVSSHKMYGPMGIGALYVSSTAPRPRPIMLGGGQEAGMRSGTEPVPLASGFGVAAAMAIVQLADDAHRAEALLARFLDEMSSRQVRFSLNSENEKRVPGAASLCLHGVDAQSLAQALASEVMVSTSSACTDGQITTSHVLSAMGLDADASASTLRIFFDRYTDEDAPSTAAQAIARQVNQRD